MQNNTHKATAIMVQGTSSNAGKSLLTAALCRIYARMGYKVAPFKSQNMTSFGATLPDGGIISSAQVLQSIAAGVPATVCMNPIVLCPKGTGGSEVIVLGKSQGIMSIQEYIHFKEQAFTTVAKAYDTLASQNDIVILEGAGSPAEINLQQHDIVNMRMAHYANAKVVLVGDIDRGGVFAHLYGTYMLLPKEDQKRIVGFVLNKFRGDASLLAPALATITEKTGVPFLATVNHIAHLHLPEEDSLSLAEATTPAHPNTLILDERLLPALNTLADAVQASFTTERLQQLIGK